MQQEQAGKDCICNIAVVEGAEGGDTECYDNKT